MSVLNTIRLNQIIHQLRVAYNTYNLPEESLCINIVYNCVTTCGLTEANTSSTEICPVTVTARVFLNQGCYSAMLEQPTAQLNDSHIKIERTLFTDDALAILHIYCPVEPADLALLESMGIAKKEYSSFSSYTHSCSLP